MCFHDRNNACVHARARLSELDPRHFSGSTSPFRNSRCSAVTTTIGGSIASTDSSNRVRIGDGFVAHAELRRLV